MPILIDGHNLIGRMEALSLQDPDDEEQLVRLLVSYRARTGRSLTVVFDPGAATSLAQTSRVGGIEIVFAASGSSADQVIARRVRKSRNPASWLVITSDHQLAAEVTAHGARVRSASAFAGQLQQPADRKTEKDDPPLTPDEVEAWLALFEHRE
jgi:predicted RNA-binding protein with PIN domain